MYNANSFIQSLNLVTVTISYDDNHYTMSTFWNKELYLEYFYTINSSYSIINYPTIKHSITFLNIFETHGGNKTLPNNPAD